MYFTQFRMIYAVFAQKYVAGFLMPLPLLLLIAFLPWLCFGLLVGKKQEKAYLRWYLFYSLF